MRVDCLFRVNRFFNAFTADLSKPEFERFGFW